jgi:alcohol dehydrogenase (cytochrome c)
VGRVALDEINLYAKICKLNFRRRLSKKPILVLDYGTRLSRGAAAPKMKIKKIAIRSLVAALLISVIGGVFFYWRAASRNLVENPGNLSNEKSWSALSCRARLYLQKAKFELPELSWTELWGLTLPGRGFDCADGGGLVASVEFSSNASEDDRKAGARIFRERCGTCHGADGSGGAFAPSLIRAEYNHGDSDFAIYKVLRDGVPDTAMQSVNLTLLERLQVISYLKALKSQQFEDGKPRASRLAIQVSNERLLAAGTRADEWLTYSGSYNGWRHTPTAEMTPANVAQLNMRWVKQFDINDSNIEATPLVIDGTIFTTTDPGHVFALDAKTGATIWEYRRPIPSGLPVGFQVNRGLAVQGSTLFFGSLEGYLVAINANDGKVIWQTLVASPSEGYSITGAPLVVNRSVVVGISGGEFGVRGFLAAYDVSTGQQQWKFNTIPGPGEGGHETWENDAWKSGGGATWITGSYDPATDLLYWGVGNPSPVFSRDVRPGDNLFTDSVIALHAATGKLAWYFQFTPHDEEDRDSAQTPVLADLIIKGVVRKTICWPNRNGFYYVLDRVIGEFLAGVPFVEVTWASGFTPTGRPILSEVARISAEGRTISPGIDGGTNWQNPTFDPELESVFIPATESSAVFTNLPPDRVTRAPNGYLVGSGSSQLEPPTRKVVAVDAASGARRWEYTAPPGGEAENWGRSGLLSTEGGLVFGASGGTVFALDADTGRGLWRRSLGGSSRSAPISFTVDGRQVILVAAGRALFEFGL